MGDVPIKRLLLSDFRRIEGTRELPFDAPIVLIHGSNGTGKTSVLSALELALTGSVRSMARRSATYTAHLPHFGQPFATVRADVAPHLQTGSPGVPMTISGARIEGTPAFDNDAANFYSERCYLDQVSLGQLLDLYQLRSRDEQSALEKFVTELLGLQTLDALREGLSDATDFRYLKKLALGVDKADRQAKAAAKELDEQSELRARTRVELSAARVAARDALDSLHPGSSEGMADDDLLGIAPELHRFSGPHGRGVLERLRGSGAGRRWSGRPG